MTAVSLRKIVLVKNETHLFGVLRTNLAIFHEHFFRKQTRPLLGALFKLDAGTKKGPAIDYL